MKTLYLSDLDGTLLDSNACVTEKTAGILNSLIKKGMLFTTSTARTYSSVIPMFKNVNLNVPLVLMNGVCIFDPIKMKTLDFKSIDLTSGQDIVQIFEKYNKYPLMYYNCDGKISIEYKKLTTKSQIDYVEHRKAIYNKEFRRVNEYTLDGSRDLTYIVTLDKKENLDGLYSEISKRTDVDFNFYPDNYYGEYFLEIFCKGVSKASGALQVKEYLGADRIVAFGDNMNDIALFNIADEAYAVENACDELKSIATGVIGNHNDNAVAEFLKKHFMERNVFHG